MLSLPSYVLISPARDEAQFIDLTMKSMVAQTVLPLKWVIVSDGSTDGTDEIVERYTKDHSWIELVRSPERQQRHFAGKAYAFNTGYARVANLDYGIIGNLDADTSFEPDHLAFLLNKFAENPKLGVAGTAYRDFLRGPQYDYRFANAEDVPGVCQLFRRECFEEIGGYVPVKGGNLDTIACMSARMKGWQTQTFTDKMLVHHRESGRAQAGLLTARFRRGAKAYAVGNHPAWELLRAAYQMTKKPFVIGGLAAMSGYAWSFMRRRERAVSPELAAFHRREQMLRLRQLLVGRWISERKTS